MRMQTGIMEGLAGQQHPVAVRELMMCFLTVFNRQCLSKAFVFMFHQEPDLEAPEDPEEEVDPEVAEKTTEAFNQAVLRGMKYGTLSPNGIGAHLKPYLELAISQGFLAKKDYRDSPLVTHAVEVLYPQVHAAWQVGGEAAAQEWSLKHCMDMFLDPEAVNDDAVLAGDVSDVASDDDEESANVSEDEEDLEEDETAGGCQCEMCIEMQSMDSVDLDALDPVDPLDRLLLESLRNAVKRPFQ